MHGLSVSKSHFPITLLALHIIGGDRVALLRSNKPNHSLYIELGKILAVQMGDQVYHRRRVRLVSKTCSWWRVRLHGCATPVAHGSTVLPK